MANIKFSAFTQKVVDTDVDFLVGYTGADNVRISPSTIGQGVYLPLAGGTMTGNILLEDSVKLSIGTSDDFNMFFNGTDTTLQNITGDLNILNKANDKDINLQTDDGSGGVTTYIKLDGSTTDALFLNPGNVGIGTASPNRNLVVSGVGSSASTYMKILGDTSQEAILELHADNDASVDRWRIASSNSARLDFRNNGSNVLSVTSAGNVGIGTTSPSSFNSRGRNLVVNSDGDTGITISANSTSSSTLLFADAFGGTGGTATYRGVVEYDHTNDSMAFSTAAAYRMRIDSSGNVGIGTTSPSRKLEVAGDVGIDGYIYHNGDDSKIGFEGNDAIRMYTANSVRMQVNSSGDVGIGTTSPTEKLEVVGNIRIDSTSAAQLFLDSAAGNDSVINFQEGASQKAKMGYDNSLSGLAIVAGSGPYSTADMVILDSGNVGIGTTNPISILHIETADDAVLRLKSTDNKAYIALSDNDTNGYISSENTRLSLGANIGANANNLNIDLINNRVGIGTSSPASKLEVDGGDVEVNDSLNGLILKSPDGTRYRVTVANGGTLTVSAV